MRRDPALEDGTNKIRSLDRNFLATVILIVLLGPLLAGCAVICPRPASGALPSNRAIDNVRFLPDAATGQTRVAIDWVAYSRNKGQVVDVSVDFVIIVNGAPVSRFPVDASFTAASCADTCSGCGFGTYCSGCDTCVQPLTGTSLPLSLKSGDRVHVSLVPARSGIPELYPHDDVREVICCDSPTVVRPAS